MKKIFSLNPAAFYGRIPSYKKAPAHIAKPVMYLRTGKNCGYTVLTTAWLVMFLLSVSTLLKAQSPNISYSTPQTYYINQAISTLNPANSGGTVPAGTLRNVTTYAGSGSAGSSNNATPLLATFNGIHGVTGDARGNYYVAEYTNQYIRKIASNGGAVTVVANSIGQAYDVIVNPANGDLYFTSVNRVWRLHNTNSANYPAQDPTYSVAAVVAGQSGTGSANGTGTAATFSAPMGLAISPDNSFLLVADNGNDRIRKVMIDTWVVSTFAGTGTQGSANGALATATFANPQDVAIASSTLMYVSQGISCHNIRKIDLSATGNEVSNFAGTYGTAGALDGSGTAALFYEPWGLTLDGAGNLFVVDQVYNKVRKISPAGMVSTIAGSLWQESGSTNAVGNDALFNNPKGIYFDPVAGCLLVGDFGNNKIRKIDLSGYQISHPLPAGLSFNTGTGVITGTPTAYSLLTYYSNNFDAAALGTTSAGGTPTLNGNAELVGSMLRLTKVTLNQYGGFLVPEGGANSNLLKVDFSLITGSPGTPAEGLSYSFASDAVVTNDGNAEQGTGTKIKVRFEDRNGINIYYNATQLATSTDKTWTGGQTSAVTISVNDLGQLSLSLNGTAIFTNIQLPADYLSSDKSTWKHVFKSRTTNPNYDLHGIDNLVISKGPGQATYGITAYNYGGSSTASLGILVNNPPPTITSFTPSSGAAGTLVTITGTHLDLTTTAFTIGGTTAIVISQSASTLVGMVTPGASTGAISITTAGGTATSADNFIAYSVNYVVSGAGSTQVNGTYAESGLYNSKPQYRLGATEYYLKYNNMGPSRWEITGSGFSTYYYTNASGYTPPSTGWTNEMMGTPPVPAVELEGPAITYSASTFTESSANDGSIGNTITITHNNFNGLTFTGSAGDNFVSGGKVIVTNVPAGLTAVITKVDNVTLTAGFTGTATGHGNANDIANLTFTFQNSAFSTGDASAVTGSTKSNLAFDFFQQYTVGASGANFTTIEAAIAASGNNDIILITAGTYTEDSLHISKNITIQGVSASTTIVQAAASFNTAVNGVFQIDANATVTMKNLTVRYGKAADYQHGLSGGILNMGTLTLSNSTICYNEGADGAGIYNDHIATIDGCTINNNTILSANGNGGGIMDNNTMVIRNSTITGNTLAYNGGGIYCGYSTTIINCTITNNSATHLGDGLFTNWHTITMKNTILAGNGSVDYYVEYGVALTDSGNNIVQNQSSTVGASNWYFNAPTDILYSHNYLGATKGSWNKNNGAVSGSLNVSASLANNNSANGTQTLALSSGSFAINAGTATGAPAADQRGAGRNGIVDIGAYEWWSDGGLLPVELTSFTAETAEKSVELKWITATEVNNYGFEVERRAVSDRHLAWTKIGFVEANGTTNAPKSYSFTDKSANGKISYRLKQIDRDGKFEYSQTVEVTAATAPKEFGLEQNYPNPFNPTTVISYQLSANGFTSLKIYDAIGREVATLVNEVKEAGYYSAQFDGARLSSGIYFAKLSSSGKTQMKKLLLMK